MNETKRKGPGRPPSPATLVRRANAKLWADVRPAYAKENKPLPDWVGFLASGQSFKGVRKGMGLNHKMIPAELVLDVLAVNEGSSNAFAKRTMEQLAAKKREIGRSTKKGGQKVPFETLRSQLAKSESAQTILKHLAAGDLSFKAARNALNDLKLPVPAERTLRRWLKPKTGH